MMDSYDRQEERRQQKAMRNAELAKAALLVAEATKATVIAWSTNKLPQSTSLEASSIHDDKILKLLPDFQKLKHGHGSVPTINGNPPRKTLDVEDASQARREDKRIRELATSPMRRSSSDQLLNGHAQAHNGPSKPNKFSEYLRNPQNKNGGAEEPRKNGLNGHSRASRHDLRDNEALSDIPALHELRQMIREITSISTSNPEITPLNSPIYMHSSHLSSQSRSPSPVVASQTARQMEDDLALSESSEDEEGEIETVVPPPDEHLRSDSSGIGSDSQTLSNMDHHIEPVSDEDQSFNFNLHEWHQKINDKLTPVNRETPSPSVRPASAISGHNPLTPATGKALTSSERSAKSVYDETSNSSPQSPLPEMQLHSVPALPMSPPPPSPPSPSPERSFEEELEPEEELVEETIQTEKRVLVQPRAKRKDENDRIDFTVTFALSMIDRLPSLSKYGHKINQELTSTKKEEKSKKRKEPKDASSSHLANEVLRDVIRSIASGQAETKKKEEVKKQPIKIKLRKPTVTSPSALQPSSVEPSTSPEPAEELKAPSQSAALTKKIKEVEKTKESKKRKLSVELGRKKKDNVLNGLFTPDVPSPKPGKVKGKKNEDTSRKNGKKDKMGKEKEKTTALSVPPAEETNKRRPSPFLSDLGMPSPLQIPASHNNTMPSPLNLSASAHNGSASQRMPSPLIVDRLEGSTSPSDEPDSSLPVDLSFSRKESDARDASEEAAEEDAPKKGRKVEREREKESWRDKTKKSLLKEIPEEKSPEPVKESKEHKKEQERLKKKEEEQKGEEREKAEKGEREKVEKAKKKEAEKDELILAQLKADLPVEKEKSGDKEKERKSSRSSQNTSRRDSEERERDRRRSSRDRERERRKRERSRSRDRRSRSRSRDVRRRRESSASEKTSKASGSRKRSREDEEDAKVAVGEASKKTEIIKPKKPAVSESVLDKLMADRRIPSPDQKDEESTKKPSSEKNTPVKSLTVVKDVEKITEETPITTLTNGFDDLVSQTAKWDLEHSLLKPLDMRLDQEHQKTLGKIFKDEAGLLSQNDKTQMDMRAVLFLQSVVHFVLMARAMEKTSPASSKSVYDGTVIFTNQPISKDPQTLLLKMAKVLQYRTQAVFALKSFKLIEDKVRTAQAACEKFRKTMNEAARARTPAQAKQSTGAVNGKSPGSPGKVASPFSVGSSGSQGSADMPRSSQVAPSRESPVSSASTVPTSHELALPSSYRDYFELTQPLHTAYNMWRKSVHALEDFRKLDRLVGQFDAWLQGKAPLSFDSSIEQLSTHLYVALWVLRKLS